MSRVLAFDEEAKLSYAMYKHGEENMRWQSIGWRMYEHSAINIRNRGTSVNARLGMVTNSKTIPLSPHRAMSVILAIDGSGERNAR